MTEVLDERPVTVTATDTGGRALVGRLSLLDRFLPAWIIAAMALGIGLGRAFPDLNHHLDGVQVTQETPLPIFVGLLVMMYPVLAKVRYGHLGAVARDRRLLLSSLMLNWVVGPAVMFSLAWSLLPDQPCACRKRHPSAVSWTLTTGAGCGEHPGP